MRVKAWGAGVSGTEEPTENVGNSGVGEARVTKTFSDAKHPSGDAEVLDAEVFGVKNLMKRVGIKIENQELGRLTLEEFSDAAKIPVVVVLDNVRSENNVGSFFRTSDAFLVEQIVLCGIAATPPSRDIRKTALGAEDSVAWVYEKNSADAVQRLHKCGYLVYAIEQVEGATKLQDFKVSKGEKYALVFGHEVHGVSQEVVDLCDGAIEIPQFGTKHSLNVSVSGGVVLWHFASQFMTRG